MPVMMPGRVDRVVVHAVGRERAEFEERRAGIEQAHHALARQELAARQMAFARFRRPALGDRIAPFLQLRGQLRPRTARLARAASEVRSTEVAMTGTAAISLMRGPAPGWSVKRPALQRD